MSVFIRLSSKIQRRIHLLDFTSVVSLPNRSHLNCQQTEIIPFTFQEWIHTVYFAPLTLRRFAFNSQTQRYLCCWQQKRKTLLFVFASAWRWFLNTSLSPIEFGFSMTISVKCFQYSARPSSSRRFLTSFTIFFFSLINSIFIGCRSTIRHSSFSHIPSGLIIKKVMHVVKQLRTQQKEWWNWFIRETNCAFDERKIDQSEAIADEGQLNEIGQIKRISIDSSWGQWRGRSDVYCERF